MTTTDEGTHSPGLVTDGGMETDLIFNRGVDLPDFAAFPLVGSADGRALLTDYYAGYAHVAEEAGAGLALESATWRASSDWADRLGYSTDELAALNRGSITLLLDLAEEYADRVPHVRVHGALGPRGDGYTPSALMTADAAADYHRPQIETLATAGAQMVVAYTLGYVAEAVGVVEAARDVGVPVAVSFTVETDGVLPDGTPLASAVAALEASGPPDRLLLNCAHPDHMAAGLDGVPVERIAGVKYNASHRSHAELDEATELDEGDLGELVAAHSRLAARLPALEVIGGCCGTDARHVAALWGVPPP